MKFALEQRENYTNLHDLHQAVLVQFPGIKLGYSTLTQALSKPHWSLKVQTERGRPGPARDQVLVDSIQSTIEAFPTMSCRQIARELGKPEATVRSYLHDVLQLDYHKTKWIPHDLTPGDVHFSGKLTLKFLHFWHLPGLFLHLENLTKYSYISGNLTL